MAVEPATSPVISQTLAGEELKPGPHKIQGIGAGFIPDNLDLSLVDRVEPVKSDEAIEMARRLGPRGRHPVRHIERRGDGRRRAAGRPREFAGKTIVVILPDAGERYLSTELFG